MVQISDVMHALAVFDAARQELAWAYSGDFTDVPEPMKGAVHTISEVLNEAEMRWVTSTREDEPMLVVDKKNAMVVVAMGDGMKEKKREDTGVVKEELSIGEAEMKIKNWFMRLEEVACDMRAVAQKKLLGDYSKTDDKLSARWLPCLPRTKRAARIAPTIDTVAQELEKLKKQYDEELRYSTGLPLAATCTERPSCSSAAGGQEETETSVTGDVLVERDHVVMRIINILKFDDATFFPIVGPPCAGKTTLAKRLFRKVSSSGNYYKVWVDMVKGWDIKEIHESVIELVGRHYFSGHSVELQVGPRHCTVRNYCIKKVESEADYGRYIHDMLMCQNKKLFLVLDNLQEELGCSDEEREEHSSMLKQLCRFLRKPGSRVVAIVTTRSEALAKYISRSGNWLHPDPWSDEMCWEIIKRPSGIDLEATAAENYSFKDKRSNSEATAVGVSEVLGREIASKCSGIPLAAKALGRFLQSVDPEEWPGLIRDVWNIGRGFSSDSQQLRRLPIHSATVFTHLKRSSGVLGESWLSLAYCAFVFPKGKGQGVAKCDLLNQWCSLGITTRQRGASCISELLGRSLLLGEKPASNASAEAATLLTMQDLMHDFARYLLGDRLIVVDGKNGATPSTSSPVNNKSSSAYLALVSNFNAKQLDVSSSMLPAGILALRFEGCGEMELSDGAFASFAKYLRLLDLSGYSVNKKLPDSIRHLKQLRYLKAPGIQDQVLPRSITGLHELRYLILPGSCQLEDLTESFQTLSNLLHLDLFGCSGLKALPDSFGRLWRLEHLDLSACSGIEALPESFGWFPNLSHLDLSCCSGLKALPESFGSLRLKRLDLSHCSGLKALPESFGGLDRLWHLDLSCCSGLKDVPTSFQYLTELRHLDLSGLSRLRALPMVSMLRELRHLNLSGCSGLVKELPAAPEPNELRHLDLSGCSSVCFLPSSYAKLEKLVHLNLSGCSSLTEFPRVGGLDGGEWTRKLEHLDLSYCPQLISVPNSSDLPKLQYLDLSGCFPIHEEEISTLVETVRSRGRASGPTYMLPPRARNQRYPKLIL